MRKRRVALITYPLAACVAVLSITGAIALASQPEAKTSWTSFHPSTTTRSMLLATENLALLTAYFHAVEVAEYNEAYAQFQAAEARLRAEQSPRVGPTSHASTTTSAPATSAVSASGIWGCIISHESGGNPTAWNSSGSGASGLYQFMPGTWGGYDGYANAADAPAAVQTQRAEQVQAADGWGPWVGDGCTPLG
jgi:hypothetical protein